MARKANGLLLFSSCGALLFSCVVFSSSSSSSSSSFFPLLACLPAYPNDRGAISLPHYSMHAHGLESI